MEQTLVILKPSCIERNLIGEVIDNLWNEDDAA